MKNIDNLLRENIKKLAPYSTARDEYDGPIGIYLDANENPFENGYNRYPDPHQRELKQRISEVKGIPTENIFVGNGSDEAIDLVYRLFCEPGRDNAVSIAPSYGMYKVAAAINDAEFREVQLDEGYLFNADKLLAAVDGRTKLAFLCSPNNPTGNLLDTEEVEKFIMSFPGVTVLDEAYIDFADESAGFSRRLAEFPRLVVLQTLSKAWGMAGLRLGLAFASPEIVAYMSKVKYPYNINGPTQQTVAKLLQSGIETQKKIIKEEREKLLATLPTFPAILEVYPADANFILIKTTEPKVLYSRLINKGIIVRDRSSVPGCDGCLRITVGTPEENRRLLELLGEFGNQIP